jgi:hypothetical protein
MINILFRVLIQNIGRIQFGIKNMVFPIPQSELEINTNLVQNAGYN